VSRARANTIVPLAAFLLTNAASAQESWPPPPPIYNYWTDTWYGSGYYSQYCSDGWRCPGFFDPGECDYGQPCECWHWFGMVYYQSVGQCLASQGWPSNATIDNLPVTVGDFTRASDSLYSFLPSYAAQIEPFEGLECIKEIPLDYSPKPGPVLASARYRVVFTGSPSGPSNTRSGALFYLTALYDEQIFEVVLRGVKVVFDPNSGQGGQSSAYVEPLRSGTPLMFQGQVWYDLSGWGADLRHKTQYFPPDYVTVRLRDGVALSDVAGRAVHLMVHTLRWVGSYDGCREYPDSLPATPDGDAVSFILTDHVEVGVCPDSAVETWPATSQRLTDPAPIDTLSEEQQATAEFEGLGARVINDANAELPTMRSGHCRWKAAKTRSETFANEAQLHVFSAPESTFVRLNVAGVWFAHDDVPGWWRSYWDVSDGRREYLWLFVYDPAGNQTYDFCTLDHNKDGLLTEGDYANHKAWLVDVDHDPFSPGSFPGPGDRFFDYPDDDITQPPILQTDYDENSIAYTLTDQPDGTQSLSVTAASSSESRQVICTFGSAAVAGEQGTRPLTSVTHAGSGSSRTYEWFPFVTPQDPSYPLLKNKNGKLKKVVEAGHVLREYDYDSRGRLTLITRGAGEKVAEFVYATPTPEEQAADPDLKEKMLARYYVDADRYQCVLREFHKDGYVKRLIEYHDLVSQDPGPEAARSVTQYVWEDANQDGRHIKERRTTTHPNEIRQYEYFDDSQPDNPSFNLLESFWSTAPDATTRFRWIQYSWARSNSGGPDWGLWQMTSQTDLARDATIQLTYDDDGFLLQRDEPVITRGVNTGFRAFQGRTYTPWRRLIDTETRNDGEGNTIATKIEYDPYDYPFRRTENYGSAQTRVTEYTHNVFGQRTSETDPDGNQTVMEYEDGSGLLSHRYTYASGNSGNVVRETWYSYQQGRLYQIYEADCEGPFPLGAPGGGQAPYSWIVTTFAYDDYGRTVSKTVTHTRKPGSHTWSYEYDRQDRLTKVTYPDGMFKKTIRDGRGLIVAEEIGYGGTQVVWTNTYGYDVNGNLISRTCQSSGSVAENTTYL